MRPLVVPTAAAGIHIVATVACICSASDGMFVADVVLVLPDIHFFACCWGCHC